MKNIAQVLPGETIKHTGDLTVDGDVGENAQIQIEDGSLIIRGAVASGTAIRVNISESLRKKASLAMLGGVNSYMIVNGVRTNLGDSISASIAFGNSTYMNNVNVNGRIFTNDKLVVYGNGVYEITAPGSGSLEARLMSFSLSSQRNVKSSGMAEAIIDGITYSGATIRVEGKTVIVDDKIMNANSVVQTPSEDKPKLPCKVIVLGAIADNVSIRSDAEIEAHNIGKNCTFVSDYEGITAKNIGENTQITTRGAIKVAHVGAGSNLKSTNYGFTAKDIGSRVTINVRDAIDVENIGDFCTISSSQYGITGQNVGTNTTINVRDAVSLHNIGTKSVVTSAQYGIKAKKLANEVTVGVRDAVSLSSVGNNCKVSSQQYGIEVNDGVGASSHLTAREAIVVGSLGDYSSLTSNQDKIKVLGSSGNGVVISSRESIHLKNVGSNARITSQQDEVSIRDIGNNSVVQARGDIDIDGTCPEPNSLQLTSRGKIRRPSKAPQAAPVSNSSVNPASLGLFSSSASTSKPTAIPKSFRCKLTEEVMNDPVILSLDGNTYERDAITDWLAEHRESPITHEKMLAAQKISALLTPNKALREVIEEFKQENPALFPQTTLQQLS